jgi:hypothetical protein
LVIKIRARNYLNSPQGINPQINGLMSGGMSIWRIRYNKEIYTLYGDPELSTVIKLRRLQWAGHVQRMESLKYTQDGDGWSDVWKTPSREA